MNERLIYLLTIVINTLITTKVFNMSLKTPLEMFYQWEETHPETVYLKQPVDGVIKDFTWREVGDQARRVAATLLAMDLPKNSHIAILSKNM